MTLPTRTDGGIDWEKCESEGLIVDDMRLAAAHTRERCAKLAHECWENGIPPQEVAQRIRKIED